MTCHRIWCQHLGEIKVEPTGTDRLRWLCEALAFDGLAGEVSDVHDLAIEVARDEGHDEPTPGDYFEAYLQLIDAAMKNDNA
jgi:hypothetical protein